MKQKWGKQAITIVLVLALVIGLCFTVGEKNANALILSATISPVSNTNLAVEQTLTLTGSYSADPGDTVVPTWSTSDPTKVEIVSSTATSCVVKGVGAGTSTITYSVDTNPASGAKTATVNLTVHAMSITSANPLTFNVLQTSPVTVNYPNGGGTSNFTLTSADPLVATVSGRSLYGQGFGTTNVTVTSGSGTFLQTLTLPVSVNRITPSLSISTPMGTSNANPYRIITGQSFTATANTNSNATISWTCADPGITLTPIPGTKNCTVTSTAATVGAVQVTVSVGQSSLYDAATTSFWVFAGPAATINVSTSTCNLAVGGWTNVGATVVNGGDLTAYSTNPAVATVAVPPGPSGNLVISGIAAGSCYIIVGGTTTGTTKSIPVVVTGGAGTSSLTLSFNPNVTTLAKGESTTMTIHVDNPVVSADGNYYVKLTRSSRRLFVENYNYSHPSTNVYWVTLDAAGNATVTIKPQYNGSVRITAEATGATSQYRIFNVTGHPTLPQTGQDFTLIYILGACCLAAAGTWVVLYARKKKNSTAV